MKKTLENLSGYGELTEGINFDVVTRHPLADELDLLEQLQIKPDDCNSCDVIWAFDGELIFISVFSILREDQKTSVLYKFDEQAIFGGKCFNVATNQFPLKKKHIANLLKYLSEWLAIESNEIVRMETSSIQITGKDICV